MVQNEIRHRAGLEQSYDDNVPVVDGEASKLGQVFVNLLLNAAQSIAEGHAEGNAIRVRVGTAADAKQVQIQIADTGSGIPANIMRRIFDPFFTTKAPGAGMGLGLAISHQIISSMNGQITVDSTLGHGSTFTVTLPAAATEDADASELRLAGAIGMRVLLIDDELAVGRSLGTLLRRRPK